MISDQAYFQQYFSNATQAFKAGNFEHATSTFNRLIQKFPGQPDPYHMLALIKSQNQNYQEAINLYQHAIRLNPKNVDYLINCAEAMQRIGRNDEAVKTLQKALTLEPNIYLAKHKLATILKKVGLYSRAEILFKEIIKEQPSYFPPYFQLGTLMLEIGNYHLAQGYLEKAFEINSQSVKTLNNLGVINQEIGRYAEAIKYYKKAIDVDPGYEDGCRNLGLIYEKIGDTTNAKTYFLKLAEICNNDPLIIWKSHVIDPHVFQTVTEIDEYRNDVLLELNKIKTKKIKLDVNQLAEQGIHPPSGMIYHGKDDLPIKRAYADLFKGIPKMQLSDKKNEKPKVGFIVTSGHEGVFVKCMRGILNHISTEKLDVSVVCSLPNGESLVHPHISNDQIKFINLPKRLGQAVQLLVEHNFDVLHYWEVGTDSNNYFIPFFKPASVQCTSWGWPVSSGIPEIDYFLSAKGLDSQESSDAYSEKLVLFDRLPVYYYRPELPSFDMCKKDFGFSDDHNVYLCIQNVKKVHPDFDQIVLSILEKDQNGIVVFLGDSHRMITDKLEQRLLRKSPHLKERLIFLERLESKEYYNVIKLADVILDTIHYGGGANTNYDAFALDIPVVTLPTKYHRGKYTATAYEQMGINDLIVGSYKEYIDLALKVANDVTFRNKMQLMIHENSYKVFEDEEAVLELENFFVDIVKKRQNL